MSASRFARLAICFISFCVGAGFPFVAHTKGGIAPPVVHQVYDDDCGAAALIMLLQRSGFNIAEQLILDRIPSETSISALSVEDLSTIVEDLDLDLQLDAKFLPPDATFKFAEHEPFIALINPEASEIGFGHFILVEGATQTDFIISDPMLGRRVLLSEEEFMAKVHGRRVGGLVFPLVVRLCALGTALEFFSPCERTMLISPNGPTPIDNPGLYSHEKRA